MKKMSMAEKRQLQEQASRKQWLCRAVCLSLVAGMTWSSGVAMAAGTTFSKGKSAGKAGYTAVVDLTAGTYAVDYLENTTTPKDSKHSVTLTGADVIVTGTGAAVGSSTIQARVDHNLGIYPRIDINATNSVSVGAEYTAVSAQDGIINIGSAAESVKNISLNTDFTSAAALGANQTAAQVLSNEAYSTIYARNLFGEGQVNLYGNTVSILTAEKTMTDASLSNVKYGTAISGNGSGTVNIHGKDKVVIHGAIESLNTSLQSGTTGIKVNIKGAAGSTIKTDLVASASDAKSGAGGKINIALGANSTLIGDVLAKNSGQVTLDGITDIKGKIKAETAGAVTITGTTTTISSDISTAGKANASALVAKLGGAHITLGAADTFLNVTANNAGSEQNVYTGIYGHQGTVEVNGNLTLTGQGTVTTPGVYNDLQGVSVESDAPNAHASTINFNGKNTTIKLDSAYKAIGVITSGPKSQVNFTGDQVKLDVTSSYKSGYGETMAVGLRAQYSGEITSATNTALSITATAAKAAATGIRVAEYPKSGSGGKVNLKGTTNITVNSLKDANGIANIGGQLDTAQKLAISATATAGEAYGVYTNEYAGVDAQVNLLGDVEITAIGKDGSYAVNAGGSSVVTLGSAGKTVTLTGDVVATGANTQVNLSGSKNTINGSLLADTKGAINITHGDTHATNVKVSGTGSINVTGGSLQAGTYAADSVKDGIKISLKGALQATSEQVFANGYQAGVADAGAKNAAFNFNGGSLVLNDQAMSLDYLKTVKNTLNATNVTYTGTNLQGIPVTEGKLNIADLGGVGVGGDKPDVTLAGVTGETGDKHLVVGGTAGAGETAVGGLGVKAVNLGTGNTVAVSNGASLTLVGGAGTDLVQTTNAAGATLTVADAVLNLGTAGVAGGGTISGDVTLTGSSDFNVTSGNFELAAKDTSKGTLTTAGDVNIASDAGLKVQAITITGGTTEVAGAMTATTAKIGGTSTTTVAGTMNTGTLALTETGSLSVGGQAATNTLTATSGNTINVGNNTSAGTMLIGEASLKGATMFLDPVWEVGSNQHNINGASKVAIQNFTGGAVDGKLVVGQNSVLALGSANTEWAEKAFNESALTWGNQAGQVGAALAIKTAQTLSTTGALQVDGTLTTAPSVTANTATFAKDSALIVDVTGVGKNNAALTGQTGSTLSVTDGAKVLLVNAKAGQDVQLTTGFDTGLDTAANWANNVYSSDRMLTIGTGAVDTTGKVLGTTITVADITKTLPNVQMGNVMTSIWQGQQNSTTSANAGIAFLSQAADKTVIAQTAAAVKTINSAAQLATLGGVQGTALTLTEVNSNSVAKHLSGQQAPNTQEAVWLEMNHAKTKVRDVDSGAFQTGYDSQFNGFTLGADLAKDASGVFGVALSYGKGDATSEGDLAHTTNDYDYWGLALYKNWENPTTNIIADLGYMKTGNDLKQNNLLGEMKADVNTKVITAGVRSEFKLKNTAVKPYAGLRYVHLTTDGFDTTNAQGTVFHTDSDTQNIWLLPVGVSFGKEIKRAHGYIKPVVDLGLVAAFGDKDANATVRVPGVNASDTIGISIKDSISFLGSAGIEVKNKNVTYGLAYQLQASSHEVRNGLMLSAQFSF
ncbi:MAG: autotransporter domain-containing protein [Acidaminococcaceae bacterium]